VLVFRKVANLVGQLGRAEVFSSIAAALQEIPTKLGSSYILDFGLNDEQQL
jgi:hypothetical protein